MRRWIGFFSAGGVLVATVGCGNGDAQGGDGDGSSSTGGATSSGGASPGGTSAGDGGATSGDEGIAAEYADDVGIEGHPDVIFADDFESYQDAGEIWDRWDNTYQEAQTRIATEATNVFGGAQALELTIPTSDEELSNAVQKVLDEELDVLHLRWYAKFDENNDIVGSSHNGGGISAHYYDGNQATPGIPADGTNKFLTEFEHWRGEASTPAPGPINVYIYHPEQRDDFGDHFFPSGKVLPNSSLPYDFGGDFVPREDIVPDLETWYCYEFMVRANTPMERDGRITLWLDGAVVADFGNLRFRDVGTLKIDRFNLSFHAGANSGADTRRYYDNVVAATSYIGPTVTP